MAHETRKPGVYITVRVDKVSENPQRLDKATETILEVDEQRMPPRFMANLLRALADEVTS